MTFFRLIIFLSLLLPAALPKDAAAQPVKQYTSAAIRESLNKLNVLGTVLYIAAHPDDENTAFLAYSVNNKHLRTAYLSLTRGDGGQNLIGDEQGIELGLIRTHELLAARKIDGAEQYFGNARDFGYSKSPGETFRKWNKEKILSDAVYIIRKLQPDIIVTRFPKTGEGGHGHHTASAVVAEDAFNASGNPEMFPDQLNSVKAYTAKRFYFNGWLQIFIGRGDDTSKLLKIDLGSFDKPAGKSYNEIAALSRSMHKSQGFGSSPQRGSSLNYFGYIAGDTAKGGLFNGMDFSWNRIGAGFITGMVNDVIKNYNDEDPAASIPALVKIYKSISQLPSGHYRDLKLKEITEIIRACSGLWLEAISDKEFYSYGDSLKLNLMALNRSDYGIKLKSFVAPDDKTISRDAVLLYNKPVMTAYAFPVDEKFKFTNPYWLEDTNGASEFRGEADNRGIRDVSFECEIDGAEIRLDIPVQFRKNDPVEGEIYFDPAITPRVSLRPDNNVYYFNAGEKRSVKVDAGIMSDAQNIKIYPVLPSGWKCSPESHLIKSGKAGESVALQFELTAPEKEGGAKIQFYAEYGNQNSGYSVNRIVHTHIPVITYLAPAEIDATVSKIIYKKLNIGYIDGAGDKILPYLRMAGCNIESIAPDIMEPAKLSKYDVILTGVRAFNTNKAAGKRIAKLLEYVKEGGRLVIQYNTFQELAADSLGPYPFKLSRDRVTDEESEVKMLNPAHQLFNFPNKITKSDFDGWVQERGLYYPAGYAEGSYEELLSMNDPGEKPLNGSLIYTKYGKGVYIYSALSFFRQIPAGVPGALKLFVNLLTDGENR